MCEPRSRHTTYLSEVELEARAYEMTGSVGKIHSVCTRFKQLTEVLQLCLGTGDTVEASCVESTFVYLLNALGDDDGDVAFSGLQVLVEVNTKCVHLTS